MSISAISSSNVSAQVLQRSSEAGEVGKAGPDHDGDADDGAGAKAVKAAPAPTVNSTGQTVGQLISVKA